MSHVRPSNRNKNNFWKLEVLNGKRFEKHINQSRMNPKIRPMKMALPMVSSFLNGQFVSYIYFQQLSHPSITSNLALCVWHDYKAHALATSDAGGMKCSKSSNHGGISSIVFTSPTIRGRSRGISLRH